MGEIKSLDVSDIGNDSGVELGANLITLDHITEIAQELMMQTLELIKLKYLDVYKVGMDVFENEEQLSKWLNSSILSLGNQTPLQILEQWWSDRVVQLLNVIEHWTYL